MDGSAAIAALVLAGAIVLVTWRLAVRARIAAAENGAEREKYRAVMAQLPDMAILVYDHDLRFTRVEGEALASHGWKREELLGRSIVDIVPPERRESLVASYRGALAGESSAFEWPSIRGKAIYRMEVVPMRDADGAITRGIVVVRDVTGQHDLRLELERSRGFLAAALEQLAEPVVIADGDGDGAGTITVINAAARELHGLELVEGLSEAQSWVERFGLGGDVADPAALGRAPLFRALHGETIREEMTSIRAADGSVRRMLVTAGPVVGHDGRRLGAVLAANDMTERHAAEEALRASEERYRSVVQGVRDVVFQVDLGGRWTFLNEAFEDHTGFAVAEALGRPCWELLHPDDRARQAGDFEGLIAGREDFVRSTYRYVTAAREVRWIEVRTQLLRGHDGRPAGLTGVLEDVTVQIRQGHYEAAERAVLAALAVAEAPEAGVRAALEGLARNLEWDVAELWIRDGEHLRRDAAWQGALAAGADAVGGIRLEVGDGLPGQVWALRSPVWVSDVTAGPTCPRLAAADAAGLSSALAFPVARGRDVHAVVVLLSAIARPEESRMERPLTAIGAHVAHFLERCRADRHIAEHAAALGALSRVAHLLASQTDLDSARRSICEAAVDVSGGSAALLLEVDGDQLACTAHAGQVPDGDALTPRGHSLGARRAYAAGTPVFAPDLAAAPGMESPWIEEIGVRAAYWQPLLHDGATVGVLAIGWNEPQAELGDRLRELLHLLAADGSLAIARSRLLAELAAA